MLVLDGEVESLSRNYQRETRMTEQEQDENLKKSLDIIRQWGEKNKPPTLKELFEEWYVTADMCQSRHVIACELCDVVKKWLPPSHSSNPYEWEKCLKLMREKLR
jgi:hypothetical protein